MKKELTIIGLALTPTLGLAAGTAMSGTTDIDTVTCTLFQDNVRITLSNGVSGGYNCNTTDNFFSLAACHTGGRVSSRTSVVSVPAGCGGTNTAVPCTGTTTSTVTGAVVPVASTQGGSMKNEFPGGNCDSAGSKAASVI